jgi:macrolide-specific efflux system membrane fusion protein
MSVDVAINTVLGVNVVKIPESTLQKKNGSYYVQVLENGNAVERAVTIGARSKTEIEILSGLAVGEQVIIP